MTTFRYSLLVGLLLCFAGGLRAQNPVPAVPQSRPIAITGATAHLGNGQVIENALITFDKGKITQVTAFTPAANLANFERIDATGKHVYPGFIAANSNLGLVEIEAVRATRDVAEVGNFNPNVRALIAFNTDSQILPTIRSRGTLLTQSTPAGGLVAGFSSVMQLDGWNWEDAAVKADDGLHIYWPRRTSYNWATGEVRQNENYQKQIDELEHFLSQSQAYCDGAPGTRNLRLGGMCPAFSADRNVYIHAQLAKDMEQAIVLVKKYGMKPVIVGGRESDMIAAFLKQEQVPVILEQMHNLPSHVDADVDQPYKMPKLLHDAGVQFCISMDGGWQQRNLPFQAGTAVAYGLPYEKAVQAITLDAARILGIADRVGSLEIGKDATLFICDGDALDMRSNQVASAFIEGRAIDLSNKQDYLYRKFKTKYERQSK